MDSDTKQRVWEDLSKYHQDLVVERFTVAVENCLHDLGVSASAAELQQLRRLCGELAKSPAVQRGIHNLCGDIGERLCRVSPRRASG